MLHSILEKNYNKIPEKVAVVYDGNTYTYAELWLNVKKIAKWIDTNLDPQAKVGILLDNSYEAVLAIYSIVMSNRICIPLDADINDRNIQYIINDASISLIFTSKKYREKLEKLNTESKFKIVLKNVDDNGKKYNSIEKIIQNIDANDLKETVRVSKSCIACILYTAGTTGIKKEVMLSHDNLLSASNNINKFMKIDHWAIESLPMRLSHSFGFARLRCIFNVGGTVIIENGMLRPERILFNMKLYGANAISSVPAGFAILLDYYIKQFEEISLQIKYIEIGSSFMKKPHKNELMRLCPNARICMHYGLTEASRSTFIEFNSEKDKLHTVGRPTPNVELRIMDENGKKLGPNQTGEILVKGQMVMKSYLNKHDMTMEYLKNGWLHTKDLGMLDDDGYVHFLGRKDEIINIGGMKVSPAEIEDIILQYDGISEVAVVGIVSSDDIINEIIKAFIVIKNELSIKDLEKFCLENMESYKLPSEFEIVDSIPKTNSGKIQRHLLIN